MPIYFKLAGSLSLLKARKLTFRTLEITINEIRVTQGRRGNRNKFYVYKPRVASQHKLLVRQVKNSCPTLRHFIAITRINKKKEKKK